MTDSHPLVSVIIPVYNGERFLSAALDSVVAQGYRPIEVIVVDDGSTDCMAEIARDYPEARYVYQANQGHGAARNTGIAAARGEFVAFLDADDIWLPNKLSAQVGYLLQHPQVGYVIARMHAILEAGVEWPASLNREHYSKDPPCFLPSALLVRRTVLDEIGIFDVRYRIANDSDWFLRAQDAGVPMAIVPQVLVHRRIHSSNQSHEKSATVETLAVVRVSIQRKRRLAEPSPVTYEKPWISVIIPVYNGARYLDQAIESVLAQTYRPIEIIVVDDGSTDESARVAQQFPVRYCFQQHSGPGAARNRGVEQARGEFLAFLDADDLWAPEKLMWQIATLAAHPELDAAFGQVEQFNSPDVDATAQSARFVGTTLNGLIAGAMLIRRAAFMRVGLFATHWHVGEFVDWYTRAQEVELEIVTLPEVVTRRRVHTSNLTIRSRETAKCAYTQILKAALDRRRMNR